MKKSSKIIAFILVIISFLLISFTIYLKTNFVEMDFEQLLYSLLYMNGMSFNAVQKGFLYVFVGTIILLSITKIYFLFVNKIPKIIFDLKIKKFHKEYVVFPIKNVLVLSIMIFVFSLTFSMFKLNIIKYLKNQFTNSNFYQDYYVDPNDVEITFPENKRNLIYIYLEATESNIMSKENGGFVEESYIPKLEELALDNVNFSQNSKLGGANVLSNTTWTIAGMVAQTAGITLNIPISGNDYVGYSNFLPGITSLGEILSSNNYTNYLMIGSDASFAGRDSYFMQHGNYIIYDYNTAISYNVIDNDYYVWWGYEDSKLLNFAKQTITKIAAEDEPFNFTLLTADTHFPSGYLDESCQDLPFDDQYANVFYCNSNMVYNFVRWLQEQDFYENTTIILSGDHYATQILDIDAKGRTYNVFINSAVDPVNSKNREFATIDMFPTTLASLGVTIEGNRLGLGTNLFSNEQTLIEKLGFNYVNNEVLKKSDFYNYKFLGNSYLEMNEALGIE